MDIYIIEHYQHTITAILAADIPTVIQDDYSQSSIICLSGQHARCIEMCGHNVWKTS